MVCNNCGKNFDDNMTHCPECGAPVQGQPYQQYANQASADPIYQMSNQQIYQMMSQTDYEPPVRVGQYIGWMLLASLFGPISLVITIVFACMGENKSRANFFRAMLVMWVITLALLVVFLVIISIAGTALLGELDQYGYYYGDFLSILMRF